MNDLIPAIPNKPAATPVIEFAPVTVHTGAAWQLLHFARSALLVWGGISLAGVATAAVVYGTEGFGPYLQAAAEPAQARSPESAPPAQAADKPETAAALVPPRAVPQSASDAPQGLAALAAKPAITPAPAAGQGAARSDLAEVYPAESFPPLAAAPGLQPIPDEEPAVARLPRARPDEDVVIASIERQHDFPRRFRRLRDLQGYDSYADPYWMMKRRYAQRRSPRVYYRW